MKNKPQIIVISFDGLGTSDWPIIEKLPGFSRFLQKAAYCKQVETVYPSLTYPAHATIATGKYPAHHGIIHNTLLQPDRMDSPDWYWKRRYIQGKTIYEAAKEKGMKTAAFLWPVTAGAKIDYHIPEIFANRCFDNQILVSLRNGSIRFQMEVFARYRHLMKGIQQPYLDNFIHEAVKYTLKKYEPDFTLIHYVDLDSMRHHYGHTSPKALMALKRHDDRLTELMKLMEGKDVTWVILGDHSSLDEYYAVRLNRVLRRNGLDKVVVQSADGSAYVYGDASLEPKVREVIEHFSRENGDCIEKIYTGEEAAAMGADPACMLMLEARLGYYFQDTMAEPDIYTISPEDCISTPHMQMATHGYSPKKQGYTTVFAIKQNSQSSGLGCKIKQGEVVKSMHLIDEGPTIAHLFGGLLPEADGKVREEFFM